MNYLIDTNVISEVRKGAQCNSHVAAWYASINDAELYLSVLVLGEIRKGIERARPKLPAQAKALQDWLSAVTQAYPYLYPIYSLYPWPINRFEWERTKEGEVKGKNHARND